MRSPSACAIGELDLYVWLRINRFCGSLGLSREMASETTTTTHARGGAFRERGEVRGFFHCRFTISNSD